MSTNPTVAELEEYHKKRLLSTPYKYATKEEAKEAGRIKAKERYQKKRELISVYKKKKYDEEKKMLEEMKQTQLATNSNNSLNLIQPNSSQQPCTFVAQQTNGILTYPNSAPLQQNGVLLQTYPLQCGNCAIQPPNPSFITPNQFPGTAISTNQLNVGPPQMYSMQPFATSNLPPGQNGVPGQQNAIQSQMYPNQPFANQQFTNQTFTSRVPEPLQPTSWGTVSYIPPNNVPNS